jgi:hypothetical protein
VSIADCRLNDGWTIRTVGRFGKVLLFVSAAPLVADIIGYERLARAVILAQWIERFGKSTFFYRLFMTLCFLGGVVMPLSLLFLSEEIKPENQARGVGGYFVKFWIGVAIIFWIAMIFTFTSRFIASAARYLLAHQRVKFLVEVCSLVLVTIGFLLDMLAS